MAKNILIFADGTGQIGGIKPDQRLSNVYKMYRAMRPGPSSPILYSRQVAYYDPGLGAGEVEGVTWGKVRNFFEQAVGAGIENNMVDCYEKILAHYEIGDRIILVGFSRGAYTVRALANVMNLCGVPTRMPDESPIPKSGSRLREIAVEAVKKVYSHGTGKPRGQEPYFSEREEKGRRFRAKYGSAPAVGPDVQGNVQPTFIGVFDTVAALQNSAIAWSVRIGFWLLLGLFISSLWLDWSMFLKVALGGIFAVATLGYLKTVASQIRFFEPNPDKLLSLWKPWHWPHILKHTHRAYWDKQHYDGWLDADVGFARHALAIDENRKDFPRVIWADPREVAKNADKEPRWLNQIWFAGCHSDVGGSYPEDESRLSDIALEWMVGELKKCVPEVEIRSDLLVTNPDPRGLQHEEVLLIDKGVFKWRWARKPREVETEFGLHRTVLERLAADVVPQPDVTKPYRPSQLSCHPQAAEFYEDYRKSR